MAEFKKMIPYLCMKRNLNEFSKMKINKRKNSLFIKQNALGCKYSGNLTIYHSAL